MGNLKKHYVGSITSEERAARIYDRHAILTHGLRAKTNYSYTKAQVQLLLEKEEEILYHDIQNNEEYTVEFIEEVDNSLSILPENAENTLQLAENSKAEV